MLHIYTHRTCVCVCVCVRACVRVCVYMCECVCILFCITHNGQIWRRLYIIDVSVQHLIKKIMEKISWYIWCFR